MRPLKQKPIKPPLMQRLPPIRLPLMPRLLQTKLLLMLLHSLLHSKPLPLPKPRLMLPRGLLLHKPLQMRKLLLKLLLLPPLNKLG